MDVEDTEIEEEQISAVAKGAVDTGINPSKVQDIFSKLLEISSRPPKPGRKPARTVFDTKTNIQDVIARIDSAIEKNKGEDDRGVPEGPSRPSDPPPRPIDLDNLKKPVKPTKPDIVPKVPSEPERKTSPRPEVDTSIFNDKDNEVSPDAATSSPSRNAFKFPDKSGIDNIIDFLKKSADKSLDSIEKVKNSGGSTTTPKPPGTGSSSGDSSGGFPGLLSSVPVFTKPIPVIVVGPKPLPVIGIGSGTTPSGTPAPKPTKPKLSGWRRAAAYAKDRFKKSRSGRKVIAGKNIGETAGEMIGGAGSRAAVIGGGLGATAGLITAAGIAAYAFERSVSAASDEALASAARFKEVSGEMAGVFAMKEFHDLQRAISHGEATAGSAQKLEESDAKRKDAEEPVKIAIENLTNNILTAVNDVITPILDGVNNMIELIKQIPGVRGLLGGGRGDAAEGGLTGTMDRLREDAAAMERRGDRRMDTVRDEVRRRGGPGAAAPGGAAGLGRGPI